MFFRSRFIQDPPKKKIAQTVDWGINFAIVLYVILEEQANMVISIFAIVLELCFVEEEPDPKPNGFVVASMWFNFVLMILFTIQTLWPICILCYELFREFGTTVLVKLGVWSHTKFLDQVIKTASNPISKISSRLGTRKKTQTERFVRVAMLVEMVRKNLMRSVERRRAAKGRANDGPAQKPRIGSMASFVSGVAMDAVHTADNVVHLTESALKRGFSFMQGVAADTMRAMHLDKMASGAMHAASSAVHATHLDQQKRKEEPELPACAWAFACGWRRVLMQ